MDRPYPWRSVRDVLLSARGEAIESARAANDNGDTGTSNRWLDVEEKLQGAWAALHALTKEYGD